MSPIIKRDMATADPFTTVPGTITPFQVVGSSDQFSVKLSTKKPPSTLEQIVLYAGTFNGTLEARAIGFQAVVMSAIESGIQTMFTDSFLIGELPTLGKPTFGSYTFLPNDTLVSFDAKNDYFVFSGSTASRQIRFISLNQADVVYPSGATATPGGFTSSESGVNYTVINAADNVFNITDSNGKITVFNLGSLTATYEGVNLTLTTHGDLTKTWKESGTFTDIGITVLPATLPTDPNNLIVAEAVSGLFTDGNTAQNLIDYINLQYPSFTIGQKACIAKFCKAIFITVQNALNHILNNPNLDSFSTGNAFGGFASIGTMSMDIRVS
jgi:hypothetical protein